MNALARCRPLAIADDDLALLRGLLRQVLPEARVAVFGSRSTGRARPFSDLDLLVLEPERLSWLQRSALADALEASALPFRVDVVELAALAPEMRRRVVGEAAEL